MSKGVKGRDVLLENGKPRLLYHGVPKGRVALSQGPIYLAFDEDLAEIHAGEGGIIHRFYADLANPLVLNTGRAIAELLRAVDPNNEATCFYGEGDSTQGRINAFAMNLGHDSIVVLPSAFGDDQAHEDWEAAAGSFGEPQVVVFSPAQLRPA